MIVSNGISSFFSSKSVIQFIHWNHWNTPFSTMEGSFLHLPSKAGKFPTLVQHSDNLETKAVGNDSLCVVSASTHRPTGGLPQVTEVRSQVKFQLKKVGVTG